MPNDILYYTSNTQTVLIAKYQQPKPKKVTDL